MFWPLLHHAKKTPDAEELFPNSQLCQLGKLANGYLRRGSIFAFS